MSNVATKLIFHDRAPIALARGPFSPHLCGITTVWWSHFCGVALISDPAPV